MDLMQLGEFTDDLFAQSQPQAAEKVMRVLDEINQRWVRGTLQAFRQCLIGDAAGNDESELHHETRSAVGCKIELISQTVAK